MVCCPSGVLSTGPDVLHLWSRPSTQLGALPTVGSFSITSVQRNVVSRVSYRSLQWRTLDLWSSLQSEARFLRGDRAGLWLFPTCRDDETPWLEGLRVLPLISTASPTRSSLTLQPSLALASPGCGSRRLRSLSSQSRRGRPSPSTTPRGRREGSPGRATSGRGGGDVPAIKRGPPPAAPGTAGALGSRSGGRRLELGPCGLQDPERSVPPRAGAGAGGGAGPGDAGLGEDGGP